MSETPRWRRAAGTAALLAGAALAAAAQVKAPANSALDAPLFYQLLIGEMELRAGQPGTAYEVILDAARRTRDDTLFRRAVDIALQARAGEQALLALRAWRTANPGNVDAVRLQVQILTAVGRLTEAAEPLRTLLQATPVASRAATIAALPRFLASARDARQAAQLIDDVLTPFAADPATRTAARVASARGWQAAGDTLRALALVEQAARDDAAAPGPVLMAIELMPAAPAAEALVTTYLARPRAEPGLRLAYVRALTGAQRYVDAASQLEALTKEQPELAPPLLSLGALYLELRRPREGEAALLRYVALVQAQQAAAPASAPAPGPSDAGEDDADDDAARPAQGLTQAWLLLAQSAEQRGDFKAAEGWLARIDDPQRALDVQVRRASMLARQGRVDEARVLIRSTPGKTEADARARLLAEAGVLREAKRWQEAFDVLGLALARQVDDPDLLYEQAMMAEKLDRLDEMERLLRRVIELKPDNAQAYNALGYSLADRRLRLEEARQLIRRALELAPGDPFITDSLGWVEYRLGNREEALRLLRQAYAARPDPEIAAHLGEVLWSYGQQDEARRVWRDAKVRDAANDVLRETLSRLKVGL